MKNINTNIKDYIIIIAFEAAIIAGSIFSFAIKG